MARPADLPTIISSVTLALLMTIGVSVIALAGVDPIIPSAHADDDECAPRCGTDPDPPSPDPEGGPEGEFHGGAALVAPAGRVADSHEGTSCEGCEWEVREAKADHEYCIPGEECRPHTCTNDDGEEVPYTEVYLQKPQWNTLRKVERWCLSEADDVATTADIGQRVEEQWVSHAPDQDISIEPPGGRTLVNIKTYLDSGQPATMNERTIHVLDTEIHLSAEGEWTWTVDNTNNGPVQRTFDKPGSHHDDSDPTVFHTYTTTGSRTLQLTTQWWGQFRIGDYGPYDIDTPATQESDPINLNVLENKTLLHDN